MKDKNSKSKLYPYLVAIAVSIYISAQIITLASTVNIGVTLQEVGQKQKSVFNFLISQSLENAYRVSTYPDIISTAKDYKDDLMHVLSYNNNIKIYDIVFFDLDGNLLTENYEEFTSFHTIFGNTNPQSILHPSVEHIRFSEHYNDTVLDILIPVFDNGKLVGVMWQVESFERIDSAMKSVSILSTGESYIIDSTGNVLTGLKYADINNAPVTIKENNILNNSVDGFEKKVYLDYRDQPVYGYHTTLNLNKWKLIVEVDETEVINTSSNINSFLISSITLILATSKLLEPIYNNISTNLKSKKIVSINSYIDPNVQCPESTLFCKIKLYIKSHTVFLYYKKYASLFHLIILTVLCVSSVFFMGRIKTDKDIQNNLNLSNQVNRRLISYYVNEVKGNFYASNRTVTEFDDIDWNSFLTRSVSNNTNLLNIVILDDSNNIFMSSYEEKINLQYASQAIDKNANIFNNIGISDIFYDSNYNQYVFYLSSKILDTTSNTWYNSIGVVSVDNLLNMLLSNEIYSSKIITILNEDQILYSNKYKAKKLSQDDYRNIKSIFYTSNLYSNSMFNVNKYKNIEGVDVFGSYSNINTNEVFVYGSYSPITDTEWQLLYEEPVSIAKSRVVRGSIDLLLELCYQYVQTVIKTLS